MKKNTSFLILVLFCTFSLRAQTVMLEPSFIGRQFTYLYLNNGSDSHVQNIPANTPDYALYKVKISSLSNNTVKFCSEEEFAAYAESIGIDTMDARQIQLPQDYFYVYVGIDMEKRKKYIAIDACVDNDFANDSIYTFSLNGYETFNLRENPMDIKVKLQFAYLERSVTKKTSVSLAIYPFYSDKKKEQYASLKSFFLDIGLFATTEKEGFITVHGKTYQLIATKMRSSDLLPWQLGQRTDFSLYNDAGEYIYNGLNLGDTIILAGKKMKLESAKGNQVMMTEVSNYSTITSPIYVHSLRDSSPQVLQEIIRDKYVFIDFWGSWCGPCIHSIPYLKELYEQIKHRNDAIVLGIALEKKDIDLLKKVIANKQILYSNYYVYAENLKSVNYPHVVYQIKSFPTYLILDKKGTVVQKIENSENTEKAVALFLDLIEKGN